jgi:hypothetical protein
MRNLFREMPIASYVVYASQRNPNKCVTTTIYVSKEMSTPQTIVILGMQLVKHVIYN